MREHKKLGQRAKNRLVYKQPCDNEKSLDFIQSTAKLIVKKCFKKRNWSFPGGAVAGLWRCQRCVLSSIPSQGTTPHPNPPRKEREREREMAESAVCF